MRRLRLWIAISLNAVAAVFAAAWLCHAESAFHRLAVANDLPFSGLGGLTGGTIDFQVLLRDIRGRRLFSRLAIEGTTPSAQLYAACGLYHLDRVTYERLRRELAGRTERVKMGGCFQFEISLGELVGGRAGGIDRACSHFRLPTFVWLMTEVNRLGRY